MKGIDQARARGGVPIGKGATMRSANPDTGQTYSTEKGKPREKKGKFPSKAATLEGKGGSLLALWMKSSSFNNKHDSFHSPQRSIALLLSGNI